MCLVLIAWRGDAKYPCVVAANRDELHSRPSGAGTLVAVASTDTRRPGSVSGRHLAGHDAKRPIRRTYQLSRPRAAAPRYAQPRHAGCVDLDVRRVDRAKPRALAQRRARTTMASVCYFPTASASPSMKARAAADECWGRAFTGCRIICSTRLGRRCKPPSRACRRRWPI